MARYETVDGLQGEALRTIYISVDEASGLIWAENPKLHDVGAIIQSIQRYGFKDKPYLEKSLTNISGTQGAFNYGNGRVEAVHVMWKNDYELPLGVLRDDDGMWYIPVETGLDAESKALAQSFGVDHNTLTMSGGDFEDADIWRMFDVDALSALQRQTLEDGGEEVVLSADSAEALRQYVEHDSQLVEKQDNEGGENGDLQKPNPRNLALDMIFTLDSLDQAPSRLAYRAGWKIGVRSTRGGGKRNTYTKGEPSWMNLFSITFVDNEYTHYDHEGHLEVVRDLKPKYATVRDVMTRAQCEKDSVEYYPFEQILEWAESLEEHAEKVIVIPKYDCLDQIPERYIVGFSVPTSHGGTLVPREAFKGRPVHLLGGSWKRQLDLIAFFGDDVVSVDNNYILKMAQFGTYVGDDDEAHKVSDICHVNNPYYAAITLSLGAIGQRVYDLFGNPS